MSRTDVGMVVEQLLTDENLRIRFAHDRIETVVDLFRRGFDLSPEEIDLFFRTDARVWFLGDIATANGRSETARPTYVTDVTTARSPALPRHRAAYRRSPSPRPNDRQRVRDDLPGEARPTARVAPDRRRPVPLPPDTIAEGVRRLGWLALLYSTGDIAGPFARLVLPAVRGTVDSWTLGYP